MRPTFAIATIAGVVLAVPHQRDKPSLIVTTKLEVVYVTPATIVELKTSQLEANKHYPEFRHDYTLYYAPGSLCSSATSQSQVHLALPSSTTTTSNASPTKAFSSAPTSYPEIVIFTHNIHRRNHSATDLVWNNNLALTASTVAASCVYEHNIDVDGGGYGQNIAAGVPYDNISAVITDLFYNSEVSNYEGLYGEAQPSMANFESWGHFTQIVWKGTSSVGCATQDCSSRGLAKVGTNVLPYFTVCNYKSPGNVANEYGINVGLPLGEPAAHWDTGL